MNSSLQRIKNYAITLLVLSGILFWIFIILNFVVIPFEDVRFWMFSLSFMFWVYQVPYDVMAMLFFICLFLLAELIESRRKHGINS